MYWDLWYGEYYDIYCDYYGCCESWEAGSSPDEMFCAGWEYYIELAQFWEEYGSDNYYKETHSSRVYKQASVQKKQILAKKDVTVNFTQTIEPSVESSNWGYYALGGAAIMGGLYFLTNKKQDNRPIDEFLLQ